MTNEKVTITKAQAHALAEATLLARLARTPFAPNAGGTHTPEGFVPTIEEATWFRLRELASLGLVTITD